LVIDANLGAKFYLPEVLNEVAYRLVLGLGGGEVSLFVPELFYKECTNIFWKYIRRGGLSEDLARRLLRNLTSLPLSVVPDADLIFNVFDLAVEYEITAYDATYYALARELRLPLVTADERLARKVASGESEVLWLGDLTF